MNDPRTDAVIAAVMARYPDARIRIVPPMDPDSIQIPDFLVILDVSRDELRVAEDYALQLTFAAFPGADLPYVVGALDTARAEEYLKGPPWLQPAAKS